MTVAGAHLELAMNNPYFGTGLAAPPFPSVPNGSGFVNYQPPPGTAPAPPSPPVQGNSYPSSGGYQASIPSGAVGGGGYQFGYNNPWGYLGGYSTPAVYGSLQSPAQLGTIASGMNALAGMQGQIGAAQAGAQGQIGAAQATAQGGVQQAQLGLQGTENTNATNQNIAGIGQATQLGLGQLGLQGQLGTAQLGLQGTQTTANDQLQAALAQAAANQNIAQTQAGAQEQVASTQNIPALKKLDLASQLFGLGGGTGGTGGAGGAGGGGGGFLGGTTIGSGIAQTGGINSVSSPSVPGFTPLDDIAKQRVLGQQDAQINQGYDTQNNAMNEDLAARGFSTAGPGVQGMLAQNEQRRLGDLTNASLNTDLNFDQYNAQNALPYGQLGLQNYNAQLDRALQAQMANNGIINSFLS